MTDSVPVAATALFVYGTLQLPAVLDRVLGRVPSLTPGVLRGFVRRRVEGQRYPAIVEQTHEHVAGAVLSGLTNHEWPRLDAYEGRLYTRKAVTVLLEDGSTCDAQTYVLDSASLHLLSEDPWSLPRFVEHDLTAFLTELDVEGVDGNHG